MIQYDYTMPLSSVNLNWMKETPDQYLFFDIETTGLSAARSDLYLIGYGTILNDEQFRITLLFNDDGCSEPKMLAAFKDILADYKYLVTYNGDTFDLPYIKEKYRQFRQEISFDSITSIDVYRKIRKYKKLLQMDSMKQSALESVMGMERDEFHSGGLLIDTYQDYLGTKDTQLQDMLLSHNKDDMDFSMYPVPLHLLPSLKAILLYRKLPVPIHSLRSVYRQEGLRFHLIPTVMIYIYQA